MADDVKTRKADDSNGPKPAEKNLAGSESENFEDDVTQDDEDGSLTKMEMELAAADEPAGEEPVEDGDKRPKPLPPVEQPVIVRPAMVEAQAPQRQVEAPQRAKDAPLDQIPTENGLKDDTATGALLLYALYRAAKAVVAIDGNAREAMSAAAQKIKDKVSYYTGNQVESVRLLPEENGMKVAIDKTGRPLWASMKTADQGEKTLIFDWRQDGGLTINFEGPSGFEGRIASREKIEIAEGGKSLRSSDGTWLATSANGSIEKWEGELALKPGKSSLSWTPAFGERDNPLTPSAEQKTGNIASDSLATPALDGMSQSKEATLNFTFRERVQLKELYQGLIKGSLPAMEKALKDICASTQSESRKAQLLNHFIENAGLAGKVEVQQSASGTRLVFDDAKGNLLGISGVADEASFAQRAEDGKKVPTHDSFLDLVRTERAARTLMAERAQNAAEGKSADFQKAELARKTLTQAGYNHFDLAAPQRLVVQDLVRRFTSGDMDGFKRLIQSYDQKPQEVEPLLKAFVSDMKRFSKDFDGSFTAVKNVAREYGYFTFGDGKNQIGISTEQGTPSHVVTDGEPGLRRTATKIGGDLSNKVVRDTVAMQLDPVEEVRQPMTGVTNTDGLWSPNYIDALPKDVLAELQKRISSEYALGGHEQMRDFAIRAGQTVSSWERTHQALQSRQELEERSHSNMDQAKQDFLSVRDEVLKKIGLDKLPENMTLDSLQSSSSALVTYLNSKEAKAAGIAETRAKAKAVEEFQVARHNAAAAEKSRNTAFWLFAGLTSEFLAETGNHAFPDGLTGKDITASSQTLKEYLSHPDAAKSGVKDIQKKLQAIEECQKMEADAQKAISEKFEPALKRYHEIRDEVLTRLGADKIPSGITSSGLKYSAEMVRDLLKTQGDALGIRDLERKIAIADRAISTQATYETARQSVNELFESRRRQFETLANEMARDMGLPPVKLEIVTWDKNAHGDYLDGRIRVNRQHLLNSSQTSVAGTVYHELIHAEQQYRMCRYLADEYFKQNGQQPTSKALRDAWNGRVGGNLSETYSQSVLDQRADQPLAADAAQAAEKLVTAWHKMGAVGTNYDKSMDSYYRLFRTGEDIAGFYGGNSTEKLLDAYAKTNHVGEIARILPGAEFQTETGRVKSDTILRELVRDRIAYLNGETKNWDRDAARQKMFDAIVARRLAINEWREAEWASYGGPDKKHEYDAQVGGLFFERQAQEHKAKPAEFRAVEELLHGQKKDWLPENIRKQVQRDSTTFGFSEAAEFPSANGNVKVKGVELKDSVVSVLCQDANGKVTSNRAMADLMLQAIKARTGHSGDFTTIAADPLLKAELLARYMQDINTSNLASYHQASQLGERKSAIPHDLRWKDVSWKDVELHMQDRLPEGISRPEDLIYNEIKSLERLDYENLNKAITDYKAKLSERLGREGEALVRELASNKVPLNITVREHLAKAQARFENQVGLFGKPANYEEVKAIFETLKLSGKEKEAAIQKGQARFAQNKEIWQEILPKINASALEQKRQEVVQSLKERGFTDARVDPARKFDVFDLGCVLRIASAPGTADATTTAGKYLPLPFTDLERTVLTTSGQDIDLAAAERAESAISHARDQVQRGQVKTHHELEALIANDYLNSQLEAGRLSTVEDLLRGGRRAINPHEGNFFGFANLLIHTDPAYRQRIEQVLKAGDSHTNKAVIDGKEISFATLSRQTNQDGSTDLLFKGTQDIADRARVERRKEALFSEIQSLTKQEGDPGRLKQITRSVAELEWLSVQSADYWRGSSELAQMRSRALFDAAGVETGRYKKGVNPGMEALTTSLSDFVANYEKLYENPPRFNPGEFRPSNRFARALLDTRAGEDTGKVQDDGSLFFELKEQRKVKVDGVEHTIVGVEARDGKTAVVTSDQFGRSHSEPKLTQAYLSNMESSLRSKPMAQGAVMNDARLAANVLSRVIDEAPDEVLQASVDRFEVKKSQARDAFLEKHYFTKGNGRVEWSAIAALKESLIDRQFESFRDVVGNLDSYHSTASSPDAKPSTDFDRVMIDFAKECKLAGLADVTHSITEKGLGEVRIKNGDLEIVMRTDNTVEATRKGTSLSKAEAVDAFREVGEFTAETMRRRLTQVGPPNVGTVIEIPDKNWEPVKYTILAENGQSVFVKEVNPSQPPQPIAERTPAQHIAEERLKSPNRYKMFTDPAEPEKKLVVDVRDNKVYELGKRHPLTWEHEAFLRTDISAKAADFARQSHLRSTLEKMQETIDGARMLKQMEQTAQSASVIPPQTSLVNADRARRYLERIAPSAGESIESVTSRAREFYIHEAGGALESAVRRTKLIEDAALKAGESKLAFTEGGKEFVPKTFNAGNETFQTMDGRTIELKNCRMEIRVGKGSAPEQAAREALAGFEQLKQELQLRDGADAETIRSQVKESARAQFDEATKEKTAAVAAFNREAIVKVGAFDVGGKNVDVFLTPKGVRIGNRDMSNLELVEATLKERRAQATKAKDQEKQKLESEIKELETLHKDIAAGKAVEVERMKVALVENISREYQARRAGAPTPGHGIKARAAEATGKAGAYLMIASFVASMLVDHDRQKENTESGYAPTKAR